MPSFDVFIVKTSEYLIKGVEAKNPDQIYQGRGLAKDELFKIEQPEKYGELIGDGGYIALVEMSDEDE